VTGEGETPALIRRTYFSAVAASLLALTLWSFSDNLITNVGQRSNADPKFIVHGLFCLAWMVLLAVQANLVRSRNLRLHRKLGVVGSLVAIGVVLSTLYLFVVLWKGWAPMSPEIRMNRLLLPGYALLVSLAVIHRRRPAWHKRLILVASFYMLEPVLSRAFDPVEPLLLSYTDAQVDLAWWIFFALVWNGFFLSLFVHDLVVDRRVHAVTVAGYLWFYLAWIIAWAS
jgi:uncharacterized membrane protein